MHLFRTVLLLFIVADPRFLSRIWIFSIPDRRSESIPSRIPHLFHPVSRIKEFKYFFTQSGLFITGPDPDFLQILDPGVKKAPKKELFTLMELLLFLRIDPHFHLMGIRILIFIFAVLRIWDFYPGSRIRLFSIPDPYFSIPDPGSNTPLWKVHPKKVLAKKLFYQLKICLSPKKSVFLCKTLFGCTFYKGHMYIFEISMKRRIWCPIQPIQRKKFSSLRT